MIQVNIHEAKTKLSYLLEQMSNGERVIVCKHNIPYAELIPIKKTKSKRNIGFAKNLFRMSDDCFDEITNEELNLWENGHKDDPLRNL